MSWKILISAGPNGEEKTTFAQSVPSAVTQRPLFIRADRIGAEKGRLRLARAVS
jgi:predicted ABC-type ATPase